MTIKRIDLGTDGKLTNKQIIALIDDFNDRPFIINNRYYKGDDPTIMDRAQVDPNAVHNKIPVPYARKIINTVVGYMYKPGLISYVIENEKYKKAIDEIFLQNNEQIKTNQMGKQTSIQGVGYELHYLHNISDSSWAIEKDENNKVSNFAPATATDNAIPRFARVPVTEIIPLYDWSIEPILIAMIRFYEKDKNNEIIDVYYAKEVNHFIRQAQNKELLEELKPSTNFYDRVPLVVYKNNDEMMGDFEPVIPLIDAYDVLISDSMNEFERFATAYLLLVGLLLEGDETAKIKAKRVFENLNEKDDVSFLTKDINAEFIEFMTDLIRQEIHKQSHVPDFLDSKTGDALSGVAISKLLYDFEFIAATKEAYFKDGLQQRFELINAILNRDIDSDKQDIEIIMERNIPQNDEENAGIYGEYSGHISQKTLMENFATFVKDPDEEIKQLEEERAASALIDVDRFGIEKPEKGEED